MFVETLDLVSRRWPQIARLLDSVEILSTATDKRLQFRGQSMSSSRPEIEARRLVEQRFPDTIPTEVLLLGHGAGYICAELLKRGVRRLRVIAPHAEYLKLALGQWCDTSILQDPGFELELLDPVPPTGPCGAILEVPSCVRQFAWELARCRVSLEQLRSAELKLKIMVVGPFSGGSLPIAGYASAAFKELGHDVRRVDYSGMDEAWTTLLEAGDRLRNGAELLERFTGITAELALIEAADFRPDLVFVLAQSPLPPAQVEHLRKMGIRTVFWFVEDYQTLSYWQALHGHYDLFLSIQRGQFHDLLAEQSAAPVRYLPMCAATEAYFPEQDPDFQCELGFVGAGYHNRETLFLQLKRHGLKIWGSDWNRRHPAWDMVQEGGRRTDDADNRRIFSSCQINLNLHSSQYHEGVDPAGDFVNPRTFDILACGGFQLCDTRSLLPELLEPGVHLDCFSGPVELKEKIRFYRQHPERAAELARAGQAHVLQFHTYKQRMGEMLEMTLLLHPQWYPAAEQRDTTLFKGADAELNCFLTTVPDGVEHNVDAIAGWLEQRSQQLTETEELFLYMARIRDWARSKNIDRMLEVQLRD